MGRASSYGDYFRQPLGEDASSAIIFRTSVKSHVLLFCLIKNNGLNLMHGMLHQAKAHLRFQHHPIKGWSRLSASFSSSGWKFAQVDPRLF